MYLSLMWSLEYPSLKNIDFWKEIFLWFLSFRPNTTAYIPIFCLDLDVTFVAIKQCRLSIVQFSFFFGRPARCSSSLSSCSSFSTSFIAPSISLLHLFFSFAKSSFRFWPTWQFYTHRLLQSHYHTWQRGKRFVIQIWNKICSSIVGR